MSVGQTTAKEITLFTVLETFRRRKLYVLIPLIVATAAFAFYAYGLPNRYRTQALVVSRPMTTVRDFVDTTGGQHTLHWLNLEEQLQQARQLVLSQDVLTTAVEDLGLDEQHGSVAAGVADLGSRVHVELLQNNELLLHGQGQPTTASFYIIVEGPSAEDVQRSANRLAELFVERSEAERGDRVKQVAGFIDEELEQVRAKLTEQDRRIQEYRRQSVRELPEYMATNLRMLETLQDELLATSESIGADQARRAAVEAEMRELESQGALRRTVIRTPSEDRLEALRIELKGLETRYTSSHPDLISIRNEIADLERIVAEQASERRIEPSPLYARYVALQAELDGLEQLLQTNRQKERRLSSDISSYQSRVQSAPQHERVLAELMRDYSVTQTQYQELLERQQEADLAESFESLNRDLVFRVASPAPLPGAPYSPQRARIILLGLFLGFGIGVLGALLVEQRDTTFDNIDSLEACTDVPVLGAIPSNSHGSSLFKGSGQPGDCIVTLRDPRSVGAEQYQVLAMKLRQRMARAPSRVVVVTSATGGEGKTVTATNLAVALSQETPGKVLLIDCDLRKPRVHKYVDLHPVSGRCYNDLVAKNDPDSSPYAWEVSGLAVMPSISQENPLHLLASAAHREVLARLRSEFEIIVIDAPPVLPIADAHILAGLADEVLFVVRAGTTPREVFQHAIEALKVPNLAGVILNDVDFERSRYHYAYEYYRKNYQTGG